MARFSDKDIAEAIGAFVASTPAREVPAVGKNSSVMVYGENANPYKPVVIKEEEDGGTYEPVQTDGGVDFEIELPGDD